MSKLKTHINLLLSGIFLICASACQEKDAPIESSDDLVPEGMEKITFLLPKFEGGAGLFRSRAFDPEEEGYMTNLYIIAVKYKEYVYDSNGDFVQANDVTPHRVYAFSLDPVGEDFKLSDDKNHDGQYGPLGSNSEELDYRSFNVTLYPGEYRFGIVANVDLYLERATKISEFTREEQLDEIVLNFSEATPLAPPHLPMACLPTEIKYSSYSKDNKSFGPIQAVSDAKDYLVEIHKDASPRIFADMKFLCSKVRYTILFDKTANGISKAFGTSWIRFNVDDQNKPYATNIRRQTQLFKGHSSDVYDENLDPIIPHYDNTLPSGRWTMNIGRYFWSGPEWSEDPNWMNSGESHGTEEARYPLTPDSRLDEWEGSTSEWIPMEQKVWQGIVYLPENNGSNIENSGIEIPKTILNFPYHTRENSLDDTPEVESNVPKTITLFADGDQKFEGTTNTGSYLQTENGAFTGLERGYFYDVVAQVTEPDVDEMQVRIFVSIIHWHDIEQVIPSEDSLHQTPQGHEGEEEPGQ
ncbi:MAG: hypothetical protein J1D77_04115 [Muribaculaceae bacterium]|nr:hypothetical protein [Muribaculaceae bacterium]